MEVFCSFSQKRTKGVSSVAVTARRRAAIGANDVVIDPFGDQAARLIDRGFGMMDTIERRAGAEGFEIPVPMNSEFAICSDDSTLATASDGAELAPHPAKAPFFLKPHEITRDSGGPSD
jgi:hypothetical protein